MLFDIKGPPDPVQNCSVSNHTEESLTVRCQEAYDGGLQQSFALETYDAAHTVMLNNQSGTSPLFTVYDLTPGTSFVIIVYAFNSKGRSEGRVIRTSTLATPESLTQRADDIFLQTIVEAFLHPYKSSPKRPTVKESEYAFIEASFVRPGEYLEAPPGSEIRRHRCQSTAEL
ncbi:uncharacterized protein CEXT_787711 [Caerostris extrusa]|uniref:Fibronectin type-III domain-containing protein n=1 Tax=Caerostris extrusa TaxID=172846 RepID=A0AAV4NWE3_CAEEX|nr:uncharacterized protein CEXT_787711 [Caerostris extrusa]